MARVQPQMGRWCRRCRAWADRKARICPTCNGKLGKLEVTGADPYADSPSMPPQPVGPRAPAPPSVTQPSLTPPGMPTSIGPGAPAPPSAGRPTVDGIPRRTVALIGGGAVAIVLVGVLILGALDGGGSGGGSEALEVPGVTGSIPFEPPAVAEDDGLPAEPPAVDPDEWDPVVRDLIPFIEEERNLRFTAPVEVHLRSTAELQAEFGLSGSDPMAEDYLRAIVASYRALGIFEGDLDVGAFLAQSNAVAVTGLYDPSTGIVSVNTDVGASGAPGSSPFQRAVLVHELVHALQDQNTEVDTPIYDYNDLTMQRMMIEGDARRIERVYAATLPPEEYDQYWSQMSSLLNPEGPGGVLGIEGDFIYEGGMQVTRLAEIVDSTEAVDTLLEYPPDQAAQLLRVSGLFLHGQEPWVENTSSADYPDIPLDAYVIDGGNFGAWLWYVTMATRIDPAEALRAADAIASDRYVMYERGGTICSTFEVIATGDGDAGHLARGVRDWAAALPHGAEVGVDDRTVRVTVCDPGAGAAMGFARSPGEVVDGPIARTGAVADVLAPQRGWWAGTELRERERWCLAETVQRAIGLDEALAGLSEERVAELGEAAVKGCLPDRVPGGLTPIEGDCSASGLEPELEVEGLPEPVAATRRAVLEAALACDYAALRETFAESGPYFGQALLAAPDHPTTLIDRWRRLEDREYRPLAELVETLSSGWMCGPGLMGVIDRADEGCAFASGGRGSVDDQALVAFIAADGGLVGVGSNGGVQGAVLETWAETVTGERPADDYVFGGGSGVGGLPVSWPLGVPPAALLDEN